MPKIDFKKTKLAVRKTQGAYWICGLPGDPLPIDEDYPGVKGTQLGPYNTRGEALEDKQGVERFLAEFGKLKVRAKSRANRPKESILVVESVDFGEEV